MVTHVLGWRLNLHSHGSEMQVPSDMTILLSGPLPQETHAFSSEKKQRDYQPSDTCKTNHQPAIMLSSETARAPFTCKHMHVIYIYYKYLI